MTDQLARVEMLRRAAAELARAEDPALRWLAAGLGVVLSGRARSLDAALGLQPTQSQRSWQRLLAMSERDRLICQLAARFPGSRNAKARKVAEVIRRYASGAWPSDRQPAQMPKRYAGTASELLWRVFQLDPSPPSGWRQIFAIMGGDEFAMSRPVSLQTDLDTVSGESGENCDV